MSKTRVFVSFDRENDSDLHALLNAQSKRSGSTFEVMASRNHKGSRPEWGPEARAEIREADEVLVICGENTTNPFSFRLNWRSRKKKRSRTCCSGDDGTRCARDRTARESGIPCTAGRVSSWRVRSARRLKMPHPWLSPKTANACNRKRHQNHRG